MKMSLFGLGKKKEEAKQTPSCCCISDTNVKETSSCCHVASQTEATACCTPAGGAITSIKVLGAGCKSCQTQYGNAKAAVRSLGLPIEVAYITDMEKVMAYGVMSMPAMVVNEQVVSMSKVLKAADVETLLRKLGG